MANLEDFNFARVSKMKVGELIHTMLINYNPGAVPNPEDNRKPWVQNNMYVWAYERLQTINISKD